MKNLFKMLLVATSGWFVRRGWEWYQSDKAEKAKLEALKLQNLRAKGEGIRVKDNASSSQDQ